MPANGSRSSERRLAAKPSAPAVVLSVRREAAAAAIGVSEETFDAHVRPSLPVVRLGTVRVYPVAALEAWLLEHASSPVEELERGE